MKKCPRCGKEIHDQASKCPYCGFKVTGYQPLNNSIKQKGNKNYKGPRRRSPFMRTIIIMMIFFAPSFIYYYMFASNATSSISSSDTYDLGELGAYDKSIESNALYIFDSIDSFDGTYSNVSKMAKEYQSYYSVIEGIFTDGTISEDDTIIVYENNNVEAKLNYSIKKDNIHYEVTIDIDRINSVKEFTVKEYDHNLTKFDDISSIDTSTLNLAIRTLGKEDNADLTKIDSLEDSFNQKFESHDLGKFGIKCNDGNYIYRITGDEDDTFTVLINYDGTLK